jgi:hypothetical protein
MGAAFWFNYKFIDGNDFLDLAILIGIICVPCGCTKKHRVSESDFKKIEKMIYDMEVNNERK